MSDRKLTRVRKLAAAVERLRQRRNSEQAKSAPEDLDAAPTKTTRITKLNRVKARVSGWLSDKPYSLTVVLFVGLGLFYALEAAFTESRPVAAFAEELAIWLVWPMAIAGGLVAGIPVGKMATTRLKSTLVGWIIGIALFYSVAFGIYFGASQVPGIGWRLDRATERM